MEQLSDEQKIKAVERALDPPNVLEMVLERLKDYVAPGIIKSIQDEVERRVREKYDNS